MPNQEFKRDTQLEKLAQFNSDISFVGLADDLKEKTKACLLYGISVGIASTSAKENKVLRHFQVMHTVNSGARRFSDGRSMVSSDAAYANAVLLHLRVQDDAHASGHFGAVVLPTALAVAEEVNASGSTLLAGIVAGYETALRIGRDHCIALSQRGFRTTPIYGVFGAAAAAGRIFCLNASEMANALSLAANFAGGLRTFVSSGTSEYAIEAGFAARNGIEATRLASVGMTAADNVLNGDAGFYKAYADNTVDYGKRLALKLGTQFEMQLITYKPYPICQFHRGIVRGLAMLRKEIQDEHILQRVEIRMHPFEADFFGVRYTGPFTQRAQAFMSAPLLAAIAWKSGTVSFKSLQNISEEDHFDFISRVDVISDHTRERYKPSVTVILKSGSVHTWTEVEGEDSYDLTWVNALKVAYQLFDEVEISRAKLDLLIKEVSSLENAPSVKSLIDCVCNLTQASSKQVSVN